MPIKASTIKEARSKLLKQMEGWYSNGIPSYGATCTIYSDGTRVGEIRISKYEAGGKPRWISSERATLPLGIKGYRHVNEYLLNKDGSLGKKLGDAYKV